MYFKNEDTSLLRTFYSVPMVSGLERFHYITYSSMILGLKYHTSVTAYLKNTPTDQESKEV